MSAPLLSNRLNARVRRGITLISIVWAILVTLEYTLGGILTIGSGFGFFNPSYSFFGVKIGWVLIIGLVLVFDWARKTFPS